jgi:transposase-like protein
MELEEPKVVEAPHRPAPRRTFDPTEIGELLKRHLVGAEKVSDLCQEFDISPNQFYRWQKELFDNAAAAFQRQGKRENAKIRSLEQRNVALTTKLARKDEVIAELLEDHVRLKKSLGEN